MKGLNSEVYEKMVLQANEAKELGLKKLAEGVLGAVGSTPRDEAVSYSWAELQADAYGKIWKVAVDVINYHDLKNVDIQEVDSVVSAFAKQLVKTVEASIGVSQHTIGGLDPKVPGQS